MKTKLKFKQTALPLFIMAAIFALQIVMISIHDMQLKTMKTAEFILTSLPFIVGGVLLILYASHSANSRSVTAALIFVFIALSGCAVQTYVSEKTPVMRVIFSTVSVIAAVGFILFFLYFSPRFLHSKFRYLLAIYILVGIMLSMMLILFCSARINGARNWIFIFGISIQLTEIVKFLYFLFLFLLVQCEQDTIFKLRIGIGVTGVLGICFVLISELATFLVILFAYIAVSFIFLNMRASVILLIASIVLIGGCYLAVFSLHDICAQGTDPISIVMAKTYDRLTYNDVYQSDTALQAMMNGGIFGFGTYFVEVWAGESDFVLSNVVQCFGVIYCLILLLLTAVIPYEVFASSRDTSINNSPGFKLSVIFTVGLMIPMIINSLSCFGIWPTAGLGFGLISEGGTQNVFDAVLAAGITGGLRTAQEEHTSLTEDFERITGKRRFTNAQKAKAAQAAQTGVQQ